MERLYEEIVFRNDSAPALNQTNLNKISHALAQVDERVVGLGAYEVEAQEAKEIAQTSASNAQTSATNAQTSATNAEASANNAKTYAENAEAVVGIGIATTERAGIVKASDTIGVDADGTAHVDADSSDISHTRADNTTTTCESAIRENASGIATTKGIISDTWTSRGYSQGDYAIYNNTLYKCILTHASGITPTNSTYWSATNVGAEITDMNTLKTGYLQNKTSYVRVDYSSLIKVGRIVVFQIDIGIQNLTSAFTSDFVTIADLPSGFVPSKNFYIRITNYDNSYSQFKVGTDGKLSLWGSTTTFTGGRFQMVYII